MLNTRISCTWCIENNLCLLQHIFPVVKYYCNRTYCTECHNSYNNFGDHFHVLPLVSQYLGMCPADRLPQFIYPYNNCAAAEKIMRCLLRLTELIVSSYAENVRNKGENFAIGTCLSPVWCGNNAITVILYETSLAGCLEPIFLRIPPRDFKATSTSKTSCNSCKEPDIVVNRTGICPQILIKLINIKFDKQLIREVV